MTISFDEKLRANDLSNDFLDTIIKSVMTAIQVDEDTMNQIKEEINENYPDVIGKDFDAYVEDEVERVAERAVDKVRIYCTFDVEI